MNTVENNKNLDFQTTVEYCVARGKIKKKQIISFFYFVWSRDESNHK